MRSIAQRTNDWLKKNKKNIEKDVKSSNKLYKKQSDSVKDIYGGQITDTKNAYEGQYRENAIQKIINERKVSESMANMGITDSGLSRTQQTAVQLSYGNNKGEIDRARQSSVDALAREMNSQLSTIEQNRLAAEQTIRDKYRASAESAATASYNADVQAAAQVATARAKAAATQAQQQQKDDRKISYLSGKDGKILIKYDYNGMLEDNGVTVKYDKENKVTYYYDNKNNKVVTFGYHENPYTGTTNKDAERPNGCFSNGYQPNNIGGTPLVWSGKAEDTIKIGYNRSNRVFNLQGTNKYYVWESESNEYKPVTRVSGGWQK